MQINISRNPTKGQVINDKDDKDSFFFVKSLRLSDSSNDLAFAMRSMTSQ